MGKKNIVFNDYMSRKERFADLYNGVVFRGEPVVRPEALTTIDSKLWRCGGGPGGCHEYIRDNAKVWEYRGRHMVLGLEPEALLHLALPVKYMNYESVQHDRDYKACKTSHRRKKDLDRQEYISGISEEECLMPVVTIGVYLGRDEWAGATSMGELTGIDHFPPEIRPFCNDFHVNIVDVRSLETSDVFRTDLREVFGFLKRQDDWPELERYVKENEAFRHLEEDAFDVIAAYSDSRGLAVRKEEFEEKGAFDMCLALEQMEEQAIKRGRSEGLAEGRVEGRNEGLAEGRVEGRNEGLAEGRVEGRNEGLAEGRFEGVLISVRNLMESTGMEAPEAMHILKIPKSDQPIYIRRMFEGD